MLVNIVNLLCVYMEKKHSGVSMSIRFWLLNRMLIFQGWLLLPVLSKTGDLPTIVSLSCTSKYYVKIIMTWGYHVIGSNLFWTPSLPCMSKEQ